MYHDGVADDVEITRPIVPFDDFEWTFLGSYNFSAGDANVVLSDKSDGQMVFADAIKWVKR